jgi:hypothetical protein
MSEEMRILQPKKKKLNEYEKSIQPFFFDEFEIDEQFQQLKRNVLKAEVDIYKFISPTKNKKAAVRAKKLLYELKKMSFNLKKSINKQMQHNNNEY